MTLVHCCVICVANTVPMAWFCSHLAKPHQVWTKHLEWCMMCPSVLHIVSLSQFISMTAVRFILKFFCAYTDNVTWQWTGICLEPVNCATFCLHLYSCYLWVRVWHSQLLHWTLGFCCTVQCIEELETIVVQHDRILHSVTDGISVNEHCVIVRNCCTSQWQGIIITWISPSQT